MYEEQLENRYRSYADRLIVFCAVLFCGFVAGSELLGGGEPKSAFIMAVSTAIAVAVLLFFQKKNVKHAGFYIPLLSYTLYLAASFQIDSFKYFYDFYLLIIIISAAYFNVKNFLALIITTQIINLVLSLTVMSNHVTGNPMVHFILILGASIILLLVMRFMADKTKKAAEASMSFEALMKASSNIIILLDGQNNVKYMSHSAAKILKKDNNPEKLVGINIMDLLSNEETKEHFCKFLNVHSFYESYAKMDIGDGLKTYNVSVGLIKENVFNGIFLHINDISELARLKEMAEQDSLIDELTQIPNRRAFDREIAQSWNHALRDQVNLSFLMLDIDFFKNYNDTYGHVQGDELLKSIGAILKRNLKRSTDFVARLGGEEFGILLHATNSFQANIVAEKIRKAIEDEIIYNNNKEETRVTISIGICSIIPKRGSCHNFIVEEADKALYKAKTNGRNQVCTSHLPVTINQGS